MQVWKYASMQVCKYASMQVSKYTSMQECEYACMQVFSQVMPGMQNSGQMMYVTDTCFLTLAICGRLFIISTSSFAENHS